MNAIQLDDGKIFVISKSTEYELFKYISYMWGVDQEDIIIDNDNVYIIDGYDKSRHQIGIVI